MSIHQYKHLLQSINSQIWSFSEIGYQEFQTVKLLTRTLASYGFKIEKNIAGIATAFKATYGHQKPVIGLLAEYDALSGLSQKADYLKYCPREETHNGHGCGHHLIGTGIVGSALLIKEYIDLHPDCGSIVIFGCPAEENGAGKTYLAGAGVFDQIDVALTWHPSTMNTVMVGSMLANCQYYFRFHGLSSHAGAALEKGRSALDAVELMDIGVNYLREHMEMTDRIHYAITNTGGISPNVVQSEAEVLYLIRSRNNQSVQKLFERVSNIAKGAALMTDTTVDIVFDKAVSNVIPNDTLATLVYNVMQTVPLPQYNTEEKQYINNYRKIIGDDWYQDLGLIPAFQLDDRQKLCQDHPYGDFILPYSPQDVIETASSDMGDVSQIVPLIQLHCACFCLGTQPHSWIQVAQGTSSYAIKGMLYASEVLYQTCIRLFEDTNIILQAKHEQKKRTQNQEYVCPIPKKYLNQ